MTTSGLGLTGSVTLAGTAAIIPHHVCKVQAVSSHDKYLDKTGSRTIDGKESTLWQSASDAGLPQFLELDLGAWYSLEGFRYLPRQDGPWGHVKDFELYLSSDGRTWGEAAARGAFPAGSSAQTVTFAPKTARYVRFVGRSTIRPQHRYISVAELSLLGWPSEQNEKGIVVVSHPILGPGAEPYEPYNLEVGAMVSNRKGTRIDCVEFFRDGESLGQDRAWPYRTAPKELPAGTYRLTARVQYGDGGEAYSDPVLLRVLSAKHGRPVSQAGWKLKFADSWEPKTDVGPAPPHHSFDGNPFTIWVTRWRETVDPMPHEIQIDLGAVHEIGGFVYTPVQDLIPNGAVKAYEFYVSADGETWGPPVATGEWSWPDDRYYQERKHANCERKSGRFIRFVATSAYASPGSIRTAELQVKAFGAR